MDGRRRLATAGDDEQRLPAGTEHTDVEVAGHALGVFAAELQPKRGERGGIEPLRRAVVRNTQSQMIDGRPRHRALVRLAAAATAACPTAPAPAATGRLLWRGATRRLLCRG